MHYHESDFWVDYCIRQDLTHVELIIANLQQLNLTIAFKTQNKYN